MTPRPQNGICPSCGGTIYRRAADNRYYCFTSRRPVTACRSPYSVRRRAATPLNLAALPDGTYTETTALAAILSFADIPLTPDIPLATAVGNAYQPQLTGRVYLEDAMGRWIRRRRRYFAIRYVATGVIALVNATRLAELLGGGITVSTINRIVRNAFNERAVQPGSSHGTRPHTPIALELRKD